MIFVDACCNKVTGNCSFASVIEFKNDKRIDLLGQHLDLFPDMILKRGIFPNGEFTFIEAHSSDVKCQHNNYGELLAFVAGLRIARRTGMLWLYSDSDLIIKYWSKQISSTVRDRVKIGYIIECINLRQEFENNGGLIIKVSGDANPADLGFHKVKH